jgi:hypothetical protein
MGTLNISSHTSESSPVTSTTIVTESQTNCKDNESISVVTTFASDEPSDLLHILLCVAAGIAILLAIIGASIYIWRRRKNTRITERSIQYTSVPLSTPKPLYYDSVDVTNFPQYGVIPFRSTTEADVIRDIRVENAQFASFKGS